MTLEQDEIVRPDGERAGAEAGATRYTPRGASLSASNVAEPASPPRYATLGLPTNAVKAVSSLVDLVAARLAARERLLVTFVNPSSRDIARRRPQFARDLAQFDVVLPDGVGMSVAMQMIHRQPVQRVSFDSTSLAPPVLTLARNGNHSVVLIGGEPGCAEKAASRLAAAFPKLRIVATFSGFGDMQERVGEVAAIDPDIVICGMGAGHQEKFLLDLAQTGWHGCGFTCGGYLDQLSDRFDYYPAWVDKLELRWAYRLAREPRRLWRRYVTTYPPFVSRLAYEVLSRRVHNSDIGMTGGRRHAAQRTHLTPAGSDD